MIHLKSFIKRQYYLIIPIFSLFIWVLLVLIHENFFLSILTTLRYDFLPLYNAGNQVYTNPSLLYDVQGYYYSPIFALIYGILFSWQPIYMVWYVHFFFILFLTLMSLFEFNKILSLLKLEKGYLRLIVNTLFMFGWPIYFNFFLNQAKFIVILSFLFIVRREIEYRISEKEKKITYFIINYTILAFILSIVPYLVFFVLIFVINEINIKQIFRKFNLSKILMFFLILLIQNSLFLFFPNLIIKFITKGLEFQPNFIQLMIFWNVEGFGLETIALIKIISIFGMGILFLYIWLFKNNLPIEVKIGYYTLALLYLNAWKGYDMLLLGLPYVYILLIPELKRISNWKSSKNIPFFVFFISVFAILIQVTYNETLFKYLSILQNYPFIILVNFRWFLPILIMSIAIGYLKLKF